MWRRKRARMQRTASVPIRSHGKYPRVYPSVSAISLFPVAAVARSLENSIQRFYQLTHDRLLKASEDTSPEQFARSVGLSLHSVAWQLWHAAR